MLVDFSLKNARNFQIKDVSEKIDNLSVFLIYVYMVVYIWCYLNSIEALAVRQKDRGSMIKVLEKSMKFL